jgi:hypothetical protein
MQVLMDAVARYAGGQASSDELRKTFGDYLQRFPLHRPAVLQWLTEAVASGRVSDKIPPMLTRELEEPPAPVPKATVKPAAPQFVWTLPWQRFRNTILISAAVVAVAAYVGFNLMGGQMDGQMDGQGANRVEGNVIHDSVAASSVALTAEQQQDVTDTLALAAGNLQQAQQAASNEELVYVLSEGANNLKDLLEHVKQIDPENAQAQQHRENAATLYSGKARELLQSGDVVQAHAMVAHGLALMPGNRELTNLDKDVLERCKQNSVACANP